MKFEADEGAEPDIDFDGLDPYRVNDSIFAAQIEGDKLSRPMLVLKNDDVPGVHWVFWSPKGTGESK